MAAVIQVVGGGLSGLSLGVALAVRGVDVELIEAGRYPRHRVCGEFISGVSEQTLKTLGVADCLGGGERLETMVWFEGGMVCHRGRLPRAAVGISRWLLDRRLRDLAAAAGCRIREGEVSAETTAGVGTVWCAGRRKGASRFIGLKTHYCDLALHADLEMHLGQGGYVGLSRVENGRVNVCGLFRSEAATGRDGRPLERALRATGLGMLADRLKEAQEVGGSACAVSGFACGWQKGPAAPVIPAGDAVAMIPPFTGNGMSMAFESAESVLPVVMDYAGGRLSWDEARRVSGKNQLDRFRSRMLWAGSLHPWLLQPLGRKSLALAARAGLLPVNWLFPRLRS